MLGCLDTNLGVGESTTGGVSRCLDMVDTIGYDPCDLVSGFPKLDSHVLFMCLVAIESTKMLSSFAHLANSTPTLTSQCSRTSESSYVGVRGAPY
jgi:hypothetical protein